MTGATTLNHVQAEEKASWILMIAIAFGQAIGVAVLGGCLFVAWRLSESAGGPFGRVLQESFVIVGWVVIWLPMLRRRTLYRRLAAAKVVVNRSGE